MVRTGVVEPTPLPLSHSRKAAKISETSKCFKTKIEKYLVMGGTKGSKFLKNSLSSENYCITLFNKLFRNGMKLEMFVFMIFTVVVYLFRLERKARTEKIYLEKKVSSSEAPVTLHK